MKTTASMSTCVLLVLCALHESKAQTNSTQDGNATQSEGVSSIFNFPNIFDGERVQETAELLFSGNMSGFIDAVAESPVVSQMRESWTAAGDTMSSLASQVWRGFLGNNTSVSRRSIREAARNLRGNTGT